MQDDAVEERVLYHPDQLQLAADVRRLVGLCVRHRVVQLAAVEVVAIAEVNVVWTGRGEKEFVSVAEIRVAVVDGGERISEGGVDTIGARVDYTTDRCCGAAVESVSIRFRYECSWITIILISCYILSIAFPFGFGLRGIQIVLT